MTSDQRATLRECAYAHPDDAALRALADSEPTVAEALSELDARHEIHWIDYIGRPCQARLDGAVIVFTWGGSGRISCGLRPSDLGRPAMLVEIEP